MGTARAAAAAVLVLAVPALAACGGGDDDEALPAFTGATSSTGTPTTSTTATGSRTTSPDGDAAAVTTKVALTKGITGDAAKAGEAYGAFWAFVGDTLAAPPMDVEKAGAVVFGEELNDLAAGAARRARDEVRTTGAQNVIIRSVAVRGADATVCATVFDSTANIDPTGKVVDPPAMETRFYQAKLKQEGPAWRTSTSEQVKTC